MAKGKHYRRTGGVLFPAEGPRVRTPRSALLSLLLTAAFAAGAALVGSAPAEATTTREARMLEKINYARASHGLRPLRLSADLSAAARTHSTSMANSSLLFHTPTLTSLCCWRAIAENVGYGSSVWDVHRALMHSAPHRANILDSRMRQVGIGIIVRNGNLWVTEIFRQPS